MEFNREKYVGQRVKLFPADSVSKWAIIKDIDDLGWTFEIVKIGGSSYKYETYEVGQSVFFNHAYNIQFIFED